MAANAELVHEAGGTVEARGCARKPSVASKGSNPLPVPYVTAWSPEEPDDFDLIIRPGNRGIAYRDETPDDRDQRGILLKRTPNAPGRGKPRFGIVHATRQRQAMEDLLCQVCGGPADTDQEGTLWLLQDHREDWPDWPDRMACTEPPVCADCAALSIRSCPALRNGHVLVRVRHAPVAAVHGVLHGRSPLGSVKALAPITARFDDPVIPWVLASHLVRELRCGRRRGRPFSTGSEAR